MTKQKVGADILKILREIQESQQQTLEILKGINAELARKSEKVRNSDECLIIYEGEYQLPISHQSMR